MKKRRLRILKFATLAVAMLLLAWGGSAIAVYTVSSARGFGCDAYGYAAEDVNGRYSIKATIREQLAKIAAVADVVFRRSPKFLGPREQLPTGKKGMSCGGD